MYRYRAFIKDIFYKLGLVHILDKLLFHFAQLSNEKKNTAFKKNNPEVIIPPDYFLYETYKLNYEEFFKDGEDTAKEIIEWTEKYLTYTERILDWGCGVSRVVMHISKFTNPGTSIYACDINDEMIAFDKKNYNNISYSLITYNPPASYETDYFDLVYGLSIFTHIEAVLQQNWIKEMYRILKPGGVFLFTTHGKLFYSKLLQSEMQILDEAGVFSKTYHQQGHRMTSTYNNPDKFKKVLEKYFEILEFNDGSTEQNKTGGQDLWIVKKRSRN